MNAETEAVLRRASFLRLLAEEHFVRVAALFHDVQFEYGDVIVREGEEADALFVLTSGRARVVRGAGSGDEIVLGSLRPGSEFGESGLLRRERRSATVRCSTRVEAQRLGREVFLMLVGEFPEIRQHLEGTARWRTLHRFLYEYSDFGRMTPPALNALLQKLRPEEHSKGSLVIRQGDPAGPMYLVESGRLRVFVREDGRSRNVAFLGEGSYFGELSVLNGSPRTASAEALNDCRLLVLSQESLQELMQEFDEFSAIIRERLALYQVDIEARVPADFASELLPGDVGLQPPPPAELTEADPADARETRADQRRDRGRRLTFIRQIDEMDCGAAALGMVCRHFGRKVSLVRIRQLCHTSHDGTRLSGLCHAASELGLAARAAKVSPRNLPHLPLPAILHWGGHHWVVLTDVRRHSATLMDPARGRRRLPLSEVFKQWTGYAALFDHTPAFDSAPEDGPALAWLRPLLAEHRPVLLQALLLAMVSAALLLLFPILTQVAMDRVIVEQDMGLLKLILAGMLTAQGFSLCAGLLQQYLLSFVAVRLDSAMLDRLTRALLALPMSYFASRRTGDIQRRLDGARQIRTFIFHQAIGGMLALVQLTGSLVLMGFYSLKLLLVYLISAPLYAGLMRLSSRVLRPIYADLEESQARYSSAQIDAIKGIEAVKAAGAEQQFRDDMLNEFLSLAKKRFRGGFLGNSYQSLLQVVNLLNAALFLWFGATMVMRGELTVGGFVAFNTLIAVASISIMRALSLWDGFQLMSVQVNRLRDVFEQEPEQGRDRDRLKPVRSLEGTIRMRGVGFRYGGPGSPEILRDINLNIAPGRTVAVVGRSGCGKTTLIKLLAGLAEPTEGTIHFDRLDLRTLNYRDLRRQIGLVLQENHAFSDTILRNIAFGDSEPDFEKVLRASQLANAHDFIMRLPLGYETRIGESGLALSGGQLQRVAIARALYNDPPILMLDEATSALDTESERAIQANLEAVMAHRTTIVIAHRLSTIREADHIVVLEKGRIAEQGTHDELMQHRGLYFYLTSQQLGI